MSPYFAKYAGLVKSPPSRTGFVPRTELEAVVDAVLFALLDDPYGSIPLIREYRGRSRYLTGYRWAFVTGTNQVSS